MDECYECDRCGACCSGVLFVEIEELDLMREPRLIAVAKPLRIPEGMALLDEDDEPYREVVPGYGAGAMLACGGPCPMLARDGGTCTIYPTRPNCCVAFRAGSEQCQRARATRGLGPLAPASPAGANGERARQGEL